MGGVGGRGGGGGGGALFEAQRAHRVGATRVGRRGWRTAVSGCSTTSNALMLFLSTHLSSHTFVASPSFTPFRTHLYPLWSPACPPDWRLNTAPFRLKLSPRIGPQASVAHPRHLPGQKLRLGGDALGADPTCLLYLPSRSWGGLRRIDFGAWPRAATSNHICLMQVGGSWLSPHLSRAAGHLSGRVGAH